MVELADGMVLGGPTWLNAVARDADLAYGMAHRPNALFAQSWYPAPGQGQIVVWEGETVYDGASVNFKFSAWVDLPAAEGGEDPPPPPFAKLQIYYSAAWHDLVVEDTASTAGWLDDEHDVDGVISNDISAFYTVGDLVRARVLVQGNGNVGTTSVYIYRAILGGYTPEWPDSTAIAWPTWPIWTGATAHPATDFNMLRDAAEYLKQAAEQPLLSEAVATYEHLQGSAELEVARWSFRKGGQDKLTVVVVTTNCSVTDYAKVYIAEDQDPHGPGTLTKTVIATITTDTTTTMSYDMSALTTGLYYCIILGQRDVVHTQVTNVHMADLAGETRANPPGTFAHGNQPDETDVDALADDLEDMRPIDSKGSPLWYEHGFSTFRPGCGDVDPVGKWLYTGRRWLMFKTFGYLSWIGAGELVSYDGMYTHALTDSSPAGETQLLELSTLTWMATGDWYYVQDSDDGAIETCYENWQA